MNKEGWAKQNNCTLCLGMNGQQAAHFLVYKYCRVLSNMFYFRSGKTVHRSKSVLQSTFAKWLSQEFHTFQMVEGNDDFSHKKLSKY